MAEWDGNESSCSCDCGFDIPKGGTLDELSLNTPLGITSGGTGGNTPAMVRNNIGIYAGLSSATSSLSASNPVTISISFGVTFTSTPRVVVTPTTSAEASSSYGIFFYIKSVTKTGCTVRLTTNVPSADSIGKVYIEWIAIGDVAS